ncbi:MAG: cytochrome c [Proteobacteria bacterium]|nr:cytochrome c [Pseudomonadota bacterium]
MTNQNNDNTPKPLPMKAIVWSVSGLFAALAIGFLIIPAFFDSTPFGLLFHRSPPPWAMDPETQAKLQLTEAQAKGRYHFIQYCAGCHGPDGRGNGSLSQTLDRKPPNFLLPAPAGLKNDLTVAGVTKTLSEGITGSQMPAFAHLPAEVISEIAQYVDHLHKNPALY